MKPSFRLVVCSFALLSVFAASARKWYVAPDVTMSQSGIRGGSEWETDAVRLDDALRRAAEGDTIYLKGGRYLSDPEGYSYKITKSLTLEGGFSGNGMEQSDVTHILKSGDARVFIVQGTADAVLKVLIKQITIDGGNAGKEIGVVVNGSAIPRYRGGALYNCYAHTTLEGVTVANNFATTDPLVATACGGGIYNEEGTIVLKNTVLSGNVAAVGAHVGYGGGIYNHATGKLSLSGVVVKNNKANAVGSGFGGGIYNLGDIEWVRGEQIANALAGNSAGTGGMSFGGGLANVEGARAQLSGVTIAENKVVVGIDQDTVRGGGIANVDGSWLEIDGCTFERNQIAVDEEPSLLATGYGGALFNGKVAQSGNAKGSFTDFLGRNLFKDNKVNAPRPKNGGGGGIACVGACGLYRISGTVLMDASSIYADASAVRDGHVLETFLTQSPDSVLLINSPVFPADAFRTVAFVQPPQDILWEVGNSGLSAEIEDGKVTVLGQRPFSFGLVDPLKQFVPDSKFFAAVVESKGDTVAIYTDVDRRYTLPVETDTTVFAFSGSLGEVHLSFDFKLDDNATYLSVMEAPGTASEEKSFIRQKDWYFRRYTPVRIYLRPDFVITENNKEQCVWATVKSPQDDYSSPVYPQVDGDVYAFDLIMDKDYTFGANIICTGSVRNTDLVFDIQDRLLLAVGGKAKLPIPSGTEGTLQWSLPSGSEAVLSLSEDVITGKGAGKIVIEGQYHPDVYPEASGEQLASVEVDVVKLDILSKSGNNVVTDKTVTLSVGQDMEFSLSYVGDADWKVDGMLWSVFQGDDVVSILSSGSSGAIVSAKRDGIAVLHVCLNGQPHIYATVTLSVGMAGITKIESAETHLRYCDRLVVSATSDIAPEQFLPLEWTSATDSVLRVIPLAGNQALVIAVGVGTDTLRVKVAGNTQSEVYKVFSVSNLIREREEVGILPVPPGEVLPLPCRLASSLPGDYIVWTVSHPQRAQVIGGALYFTKTPDDYGLVTVTATSALNPALKETFSYNVVGLSFNVSSIERVAGTTVTLRCDLIGANADKLAGRIVWRVLDTAVVKLTPHAETADINFKGRAGAQTAVIAYSVDNPDLQATCLVKMAPSPIYEFDIVPPTSAGPDERYVIGQIYHFSVKPDIDDPTRIGWRTFNPDVVTVEQNGWVKVNKSGVATIQAYLIEADGTSRSMESNYVLEAYTASSGIYLEENFITMQEYKTYMLSYFLYPNDMVTNPVTWASSNPAVATVSPQGMVVSYASGKAEITASVEDAFGNVHESLCLVTVHNPVESILIENVSRVLWVGESYPLNAKVYPPTASHAVNGIKYEALSGDVATVNDYGLVTALKPGKEIISVSLDGVVAHCYVTVLNHSSVGVILTETNLSLSGGQTHHLAASVVPYASEAYPITWTSSDPSVAAVTSNGIVMALSEGEAYIRATTADGWNSNECLVFVSIPPISLSLEESQSLTAGQSAQMGSTILPLTATVAHRPDWGVWEVEDESVLTIDEFGLVQAKAVGTTRVTATIKGTAIKASTLVSVTPPYAGVHLSRTTLTMSKEEQSVLTAFGADGFVQWVSDNPDVVTVDANGNLHAKAAGIAVITASDLTSAESCVVTVKVYAAAIYVNPYQLTEMNVGDRFTLTATVVPQEAAAGAILWAETGSSLLSLSSEGNTCTIEARTPGIASFYVASPDGKAYRSWLIHVIDPTLNVADDAVLPQPSAGYDGDALLLRNFAGYTVTLGNLSGKTLTRFDVITEEDTHPLSLPAGVYFLLAQHKDGRRYAIKFIAP
jgi:uncharacterized protein YjdB